MGYQQNSAGGGVETPVWAKFMQQIKTIITSITCDPPGIPYDLEIIELCVMSFKLLINISRMAWFLLKLWLSELLEFKKSRNKGDLD